MPTLTSVLDRISWSGPLPQDDGLFQAATTLRLPQGLYRLLAAQRRSLTGRAVRPGADQDEAAERDAGQDVQRCRGDPHAAVADRVAEHGRVRPAVYSHRAGATAVGIQRVGVEPQRQ